MKLDMTGPFQIWVSHGTGEAMFLGWASSLKISEETECHVLSFKMPQYNDTLRKQLKTADEDPIHILVLSIPWGRVYTRATLEFTAFGSLAFEPASVCVMGLSDVFNPGRAPFNEAYHIDGGKVFIDPLPIDSLKV